MLNVTFATLSHVVCFILFHSFSANEIHVSVDSLANKVVVQAAKTDHTGHATRTFTQKVQLPRFTDEAMLKSKLMKNGKLKLEVLCICCSYCPHRVARE